MNISMTEQEKGDLLIEVTAWTGLTVYLTLFLVFDFMLTNILQFYPSITIKCCIIMFFQEFTMAEVEYQVDELFFRINTLTGSHGLPEKPTSYFTDSDGTYGLGDDGISSGGSEVRKMPVILRFLYPHL